MLSASGLRASAPAFVPAGAPEAPEASPAAELLPGDPWGEAEPDECAADEGAGDEQAWQHAEPSDALALLQSWYPRQPASVVRTCLGAAADDLQTAHDLLAELDWEQRLAERASSAAPSSSGSSSTASGTAARLAAARQQQAFSMQLEAFPQLGQPGPAVWGSGAPAAGDSWARVARQAAAVAPPLRPGPQPRPAAQQQQQQQQQRSRAAPSCGESGAVPWVSTGAAVSRQYAEARGEARDWARVRNACFEQATRAYLAGDKALARELSAKGKEAAAAMFDAHAQASSGLFEQRNAALGASAGGGVVDLHGLHVREVLELLPGQLQALREAGRASASLIVGQGAHTVGPPSARLAPAVKRQLEQLGLRYSEPQPGLLRVQLTTT